MSSRLAIAYEDADDRSLAARARAGNEEAFAVLVRRYRRELVAHARRLVAAADAEDVVQVALVRAYQALRDGAVPIRFGPWMHRIVRNAGLDLLRRRSARSGIDEVSAGAAPDPHETFTQRERVRALTAAIRELPDGERQALVGHALEGHSHRELARAAGRTEVAVRQAAQRARARLRRAALGWAPAGWLVRLVELPGRALDAAVPVGPAGRAAGCLAVVAAGAMAVGSVHEPPPLPKPHATARAHARVTAPRAVAPVRSHAMPAPVVARARVAPVERVRAADHRHRVSVRPSRSSQPAAGQESKGPGPAPLTDEPDSSGSGSSGGGPGSSPGRSSGPGGSTPAPTAPTATTSGGPGPSPNAGPDTTTEPAPATTTTDSSGPGGGGDDGSGGGPGPG